MKPEDSRLWMYEEIKGQFKTKYIDHEKIEIKYNNPDDIDEEIIMHIHNTIKCFIATITYDDWRLVINGIEYFFLKNNAIFVLIYPNEKYVKRFIGRKQNNLFNLKRQMSNIAGLYSENYGKTTITIDVKQLIDGVNISGNQRKYNKKTQTR